MNDAIPCDVEPTERSQVPSAERVSDLYDHLAKLKSATMMMKAEPAEALTREIIRTLAEIMGEVNALRRDVDYMRDREAVDRSKIESLTTHVAALVMVLPNRPGGSAANDG